jgi:ligand-binding SRPBCC domain-containing protein
MIHSLKTVQFLPISIEEVWDFFSSPENLKEITPEYMGFKILSEVPRKICPGMIISYNLKPLPGYKINWVTEITQIREKEFFVDSQLSGTYGIWLHEHYFKKVDGGVEITDLLYYKLPYGLLGHIVNFFFIRKKIENIFYYRHNILNQKFGIEGKASLGKISWK